jgi:hypothetical protein
MEGKLKPQFKLDIVTSIRLTEDEWKKIVAHADEKEIKPSSLMRKIIKRYYSKEYNVNK